MMHPLFFQLGQQLYWHWGSCFTGGGEIVRSITFIVCDDRGINI